jgi:DNA polymerase III alpha subunit
VKISEFAVNEKKQTEGVWITVDDSEKPLKLLIARMGNPNYQEEVMKVGRQTRGFRRGGQIAGRTITKKIKGIIARTILLGWKNLQDKDGKDIKYSPEKAEQLFNDFPEFLDLVVEYGNDISLYRDEEVNEVAGN